MKFKPFTYFITSFMTCAPKKCGPGGPKLFAVDTEQPPAIYCWNIGEKNCDAVKVLVKPALFRKWEQLLTHLAKACDGCGNGVRALYSPAGKQYKELSELKDGSDVVVVPTGCMFKKTDLPVKLAAKIAASK